MQKSWVNYTPLTKRKHAPMSGKVDADGRSDTIGSIIKAPETMERQNELDGLHLTFELDGENEMIHFKKRISIVKKLLTTRGKASVVQYLEGKG